MQSIQHVQLASPWQVCTASQQASLAHAMHARSSPSGTQMSSLPPPVPVVAATVGPVTELVFDDDEVVEVVVEALVTLVPLPVAPLPRSSFFAPPSPSLFPSSSSG